MTQHFAFSNPNRPEFKKLYSLTALEQVIDGLTQQQREIFTLIAHEQSQRVIREVMSLSRKIVDSETAKIYKAFSLAPHDRESIVRLYGTAAKAGLIE
jgi:DNA-directed RNA polymerase specialized sigma24 family protein